jgi:hypothetical protein
MVCSMIFFKNVKLMFWVDAVLCTVYVKNMCPYHALKNKTPYEIWHGHIPLVRHLRIFGSTCYALIPKEQRRNLDVRSRKCIFLGYSNTAKGYHLYDETNNKFILSRDVILLESSKKDKIVERHLDHLDRFICVKIYHELDDEIPHLEGGVPILGQSMKSPFEAPSSPHEEVHVASSKPEVQLDDVIERIEKQRPNENSAPSQSVEQPGPSQKGPPKCLTKTLESVHPNEVGKKVTTMPSKQDGGNVDNSNSSDVDDMDVSYDCELNLSTNHKSTSFKEATSHDKWKEATHKEYDSLIKNGTWKLVDPPYGTKPINCKWVFKNKYKLDGSLDKHKTRFMEKVFAQEEGVDYEETFSPTAKWATIRTLFSMVAQNGWKIHQMDVKIVFLDGDLKDNVFKSQPEGFVVKGQEHKV